MEKKVQNEIHPSLSIGLPVFNGAGSVADALQSLLLQTYKNFELIISDNASNDETQKICEFYAGKDRRIKYIRQTTNLGALDNFKFVLKQAKGEFFMWAAHDDLWAKDFVEKCLNELRNNKNLGFVFSRYFIFSKSYPFLAMRGIKPMFFLCNENSSMRITSYLKVSPNTHKANLFYSIWRKNILERVVKETSCLTEKYLYNGFDIAQIIFALAITKGKQLKDVLFFKGYKGIPPGHPLSFILQLKSLPLHIFWLMGLTKPRELPKEHFNHTEIVSRVLKIASKYEKNCNKISLWFEKFSKKGIVNRSFYIHDLLNSFTWILRLK
jgi:glycosyltransferase involved in cell wall biosynthesis